MALTKEQVNNLVKKKIISTESAANLLKMQSLLSQELTQYHASAANLYTRLGVDHPDEFWRVLNQDFNISK